jgi:hypothetical protein
MGRASVAAVASAAKATLALLDSPADAGTCVLFALTCLLSLQSV